MFIVTYKKARNLRCQIDTSNRGGSRYQSMAFSEQGVSMLYSVLISKRAIQVNIANMRTFNRLREMLAGHKELEKKIGAMEERYDKQFKVVFKAIKQLLSEEEKSKQKIGF
jgi:hypothetical protein